MKSIIAFFRIIRWTNLLFIIITQSFFYRVVFYSLLPEGTHFQFAHYNFWFNCLLFASVLIAAAGYIINDYFDVQIDLVNKPDRVFIDKSIKRRWAIVWHANLSLIGLLLSWLVSRRTGIQTILLGNLFSVFGLWFYSTYLKKKLLIGNFMIALLTAWSIAVIYFFAGGHLFNYKYQFDFNINHWVKITALYTVFAFILTLVREVVKDLEDMPGDMAHGCTTMPIVWGVRVSKIFAGVWLLVSIFALAGLSLYFIQKAWWGVAFYTSVLLVVPMVWILINLRKASNPNDYRNVSFWLKIIMAIGIMSMLFFLNK